MLPWSESLYATIDCTLVHFLYAQKSFLLEDTNTEPLLQAFTKCTQPPTVVQSCNWTFHILKPLIAVFGLEDRTKYDLQPAYSTDAKVSAQAAPVSWSDDDSGGKGVL